MSAKTAQERIIAGFLPACSRFIRETIDAFSLSGAIILLFAVLTIYGIHLTAQGNPAGPDIWKTFATALTTFVGAKKIAENEIYKEWGTVKPVKEETKDDAPVA